MTASPSARRPRSREKLIAAAKKLQRHRPRRHRRRQCRRPGGDRARHHRDEHALRQFDHHRRARHRADVRASPARSPRPTPRPRPASGRRTASWASRSPARRSASSAAAISARSSPTARIGLQMKVIAFDPFLSEERAVELGVEKVELDELFRRADFITLHTPLTDKTQEHHRRGGDRQDEGRRAHHQLRARRPGRRGGPRRGAQVGQGRRRRRRRVRRPSRPRRARCSASPNVVCTPHLGASTTEAQENVALQVAEQMADYLSTARSRTRSTCPRSRPRRRRG